MPSAPASNGRQRPWGERVRLAEGEVGERGLHGVAAHHDGDIARAVVQLADAGVERGQRRAARGVDGHVRAAEVEPVRDPARGDVQQDAGERILGPLGQDAFAELDDLRRLHRHAGDRIEQRQAGAEAVGDRQRHPAAADAEDDAGALAGERPVGVAGVGQRLVHRFEQEQLQRLDGRKRLRRDAVLQRVEDDVRHEPAPLRDDLVAGARVGVVVGPPVPVRRRESR